MWYRASPLSQPKSGTSCEYCYRRSAGILADAWSLFAYPLTGRAEIQIRKGERERMETLDFLNDTLIEFGLK